MYGFHLLVPDLTWTIEIPVINQNKFGKCKLANKLCTTMWKNFEKKIFTNFIWVH